MNSTKTLRRTRKSDVTTAPAPAFEPNAFYEKLGALRATNPQAFAGLSPASKMAFYAYETARREAARLQVIREQPDAA
jgi:hypothetical protein